MKVILRQDVESLGKMGDVIRVAEGYARNYLFPKGIAVEANEKNIRALEHEKQEMEQRAGKRRKKAEALLETLSGVTCVISRKTGKEDKLFGAVTAKDVEKSLRDQGLDIDRKSIVFQEPIKSLGEFPVKVKLYPGVTAEITVKVVKEED
ncbi:MAG: 50S ribosomal protein L9 [Syntrophobacterales bacterium]|jgi:large subunit ribosomal protein L9|nr:50S ribosomal protein L9 [Syntrophobacterales bacterium]